MSYTAVDLEVRDAINHYVACGFDDAERVLERIVGMYPDADEDEVAQLVDASFAERGAAGSAWPATTDCDRLDGAFAALDASGVVARHNFACCQRCGVDEIVEEIAAARRERRQVDGYVFYHMQDTDAAVERGHLHLRYGGTAGTDAAMIGERVATALRAAGLAVAWDGDAGTAIEVALRWQRRAAPAAHASVADATGDSVARWCEALPAATLSAAAEVAGEEFPRALDAAGMHAAALAWARAPHDAADRAIALARLAAAAQSSELLIEAWQLAPWGERGTFVSLIVEGGLADPRVQAIAGDKIIEASRDEFGGAAAAWFAAWVPEDRRARERALAAWHNQHQYDDEGALLALAAGLWRAGEDLRSEVLRRFSDEPALWAQCAAIAAATTVEDVLAFAEPMQSMYSVPLRRSYCARLVDLGAVDAARTYAASLTEPFEAYVASRAGDTQRLAAIRARADEHALQYEEGLITDEERTMLRFAFAGSTAACQQLAAHGRDACATALADGRADALAYFAGQPAGLAVRAETEAFKSKLANAIATWKPDLQRRERLAHRRAGRILLEAAAVHAGRGELARARELREIALAPFADQAVPDDAIDAADIGSAAVMMWVAFGELDTVAQFTVRSHGVERRLSTEALGCYVTALHAAGQIAEARARLGAAFSRSQLTRRELVQLLPAVLALAGDERVHLAWRSAEQALDALTAPLDGAALA